MILPGRIYDLVQGRHLALRVALRGAEDAMAELEDSEGRVITEEIPLPARNQPRWTPSTGAGRTPRVRVHDTGPLRRVWNTYVAEIEAHLDREEALVPPLVARLRDGTADRARVALDLEALILEHELLGARTVEVRQAFLAVGTLRRAFAPVEQEFAAHALAEDTHLYRRLLQQLQPGLDLGETPAMARYRVVDPMRDLRDNLVRPPPVARRVERGWLSWFRNTFARDKGGSAAA